MLRPHWPRWTYRRTRQLTRELPGHVLRVRSGHALDAADHLGMPERRDEPDANAFDLVRARRPAREHSRLVRLDCGDVNHRVVRPKRLGHTVDGVRRADRVHESRDLASCLRPDFFPKWSVAAHRVLIVELIAPPVPGPRTQVASRSNHFLDECLGDSLVVAPDIGDASAERLHHATLLVAEGVGKHDLEVVSLRRANEGQRNAGRASRVLDNRATWHKTATRLGGLDRRSSHSVLHAPGRIGPLQFHEDRCRTRCGHVADVYQRRVADAGQNAFRRACHVGLLAITGCFPEASTPPTQVYGLGASALKISVTILQRPSAPLRHTSRYLPRSLIRWPDGSS